MTTTLHARVPQDLLAAVPVVLGFRPHDSVVMLTFGGLHSFHARVDLPARDALTASLPELVETLLTPAVIHQAGRVVFVSYTDDARLSACVGAALRRGFVQAGIGVVDVLRVDGGAWCRVPAGAGGRETAMTPYDDTSHPFTAQAVFEGRVTLASREALRDTLATLPEAVARVTAHQACSRPPRRTDVRWVQDLVARCARTGKAPDDAEAARALRAVVRVDVRDAVLRDVRRDCAAEHLQVWADLLRRAPAPQVPETAAVTAFCAWQAGHGALAWCALDRCLDLEPSHRLGLCLAECLTRAVPPSAWEETGDGRARGSGPARAGGGRQVRPPPRT